MVNDLLLYGNSCWQEKLGLEFRRNNLENRLHLVFSSKIKEVKSRAGRFMGYTETANDEATRFPPTAIWHAWLEIFPKCKPHIYKMIRAAACEIALAESDNIIKY